MSQRDAKLRDMIKEAAVKFLNVESNRVSLMTVTNVMLTKNNKHATIFFTVFPNNKGKAALDFIQTKEGQV